MGHLLLGEFGAIKPCAALSLLALYFEPAAGSPSLVHEGENMSPITRLSSLAVGIAILAVSMASSQCPDPPPSTAFTRSTLIAGSILNQPIEMTVTKDGRVFVAERG